MSQSHNLKLLALTALLVLTPLVSTPLRLKYLYFIVNILIIAVGADAGLLNFILQSTAHHKVVNLSNISDVPRSNATPDEPTKNSDKIKKSLQLDAVKLVETSMEKSPDNQSPSIFFVGGDDEVDDGDDEAGEEELFEKAETFIGNFYKQLKMQREESLKELHGFEEIK